MNDEFSQLILARLDSIERKMDGFLSKETHDVIVSAQVDRINKLERAVYGAMTLVVVTVFGALISLVIKAH